MMMTTMPGSPAPRFNPASGWPVPPTGWSPPFGWAPDPSCPPAPAGWQFWLRTPDPSRVTAPLNSPDHRASQTPADAAAPLPPRTDPTSRKPAESRSSTKPTKPTVQGIGSAPRTRVPHGYTVIDVETTRLSPKAGDRVVEIAVVYVSDAGDVQDCWSTLVNPHRDVGPTRIHASRLPTCSTPRASLRSPRTYCVRSTVESSLRTTRRSTSAS